MHILQFSSWINPILGVLLGTVLSIYKTDELNLSVFFFMLATIILVQIFSNLCKEYSREDGIQSKYEFRLVDNKIVTRMQIYRYTKWALFLSTIAGFGLIYLANLELGSILIFSGLGIMTMTALLRYSVGDNPYNFGLRGELVYLSVYGWLIVYSSFFLQVHSVLPITSLILDTTIMFYPATACGLTALACLNLINMRDSYVSLTYKKENFATYLGFKASRVIQTTLYFLAVTFYASFNFYYQLPLYTYSFFIVVPLIIYHLYVIHSHMQTKVLNNQRWITLLINIILTGTFMITQLIFIFYGRS